MSASSRNLDISIPSARRRQYAQRMTTEERLAAIVAYLGTTDNYQFDRRVTDDKRDNIIEDLYYWGVPEADLEQFTTPKLGSLYHFLTVIYPEALEHSDPGDERVYAVILDEAERVIVAMKESANGTFSQSIESDFRSPARRTTAATTSRRSPPRSQKDELDAEITRLQKIAAELHESIAKLMELRSR